MRVSASCFFVLVWYVLFWSKLCRKDDWREEDHGDLKTMNLHLTI